MDDSRKQELRIAREQYERGNYGEAEPLLTALLPDCDHFADVHNMIGVIAHQRQEFERAEEHFARALQLNPNYTEAALNLSVTYNDLGRYDLARQVHERATNLRGSETPLEPLVRGKLANMHEDIGQAYRDAGLLRDAIPELEKAVRLCPTFADLRYKLGSLYRETGELMRARIQFEAAKHVNPRFPAPRVALAVTLISLGERRRGEEELLAVLEIDPAHKAANMYLRALRTGRSSSFPAPGGGVMPPKDHE